MDIKSSGKFSTGYLKIAGKDVDLFLSVSPGFEQGPGIDRDGITLPRMADPHSVDSVCFARNLQPRDDLGHTTNAIVQRVGTWTLYHHLKKFIEKRGAEWRVIGVLSNGDLTMNPWHIAYIRKSHIDNGKNVLCALSQREPISNRIYRCFVKWDDAVARRTGVKYEFLDLMLKPVGHNVWIKLAEPKVADDYEKVLKQLSRYKRQKNIAPLIEFALSGKPIIVKKVELPLSSAADKFQDVRHIFNLPTVKAEGSYERKTVTTINFGEYQLFCNLNERRAALLSPVVIDLDIKNSVGVRWETLRETLIRERFKETEESPTRRGQFRKYTDDIYREKVEVFFPFNVYPFGVLGLKANESGVKEIVCLSSGGLSGGIGNTLEGITRVMFDYFGCDDAMVLDEGLDTFQIINPVKEGGYAYSNEELLAKILTFTKGMVDEEEARSKKESYEFAGGMKAWPLNRDLLSVIDADSKTSPKSDYTDVLIVRPHRSQMRSVLILAERR
ncbi:MAG TPA: hypothetical protein VGV59_09555 [Pyrinomonadaceae bacterium]|nr:hypothetical protein [Pyrinomonadaceae bacterium]